MKPLLQALSGAVQSPPPIWLMRQAGRYLPEYRKIRALSPGFIDLCLNPDLATEITLQPIRRFGMDAAILFSDILMVPLGLGQRVDFHEGPVLDAIRGKPGLEQLSLDSLEERLAPVYEIIRRVRRELPEQTALIGFAGAPWTVAAYMLEGGSSRDFTISKAWADESPEDFTALIELLIEATTRHLLRQIEAGAEVIQLFDSWAGVLEGTLLESFVIEPAKWIVARLKKAHPQVPIIGFPRGIGANYVRYARETGVDAVSLDQNVPIAWAAQEIQPLCPVQGNLDPQILVAGGQKFRDAVRAILEGFGKRPFVFNLGHGIVPETPVEHVEELVRLVRESGASAGQIPR